MEQLISKFFTGQAIEFTVVDVQEVKAEDSNAAVKTFSLRDKPEIRQCLLSITGGGTGGFAAALGYLQAQVLNDTTVAPSGQGRKLESVILSEETAWLGGQLTSQGVSALDENKWIETSGGCRSYLNLRKKIRDYYARSAKPEYAGDPLLHPGRSWVTRLSFEPKKVLPLLDETLAAYKQAGDLKVLTRHKVVSASTNGQGELEALLLVNLDSGKFVEIQARLFIDATELGDLFPLARIPYRTGSDDRATTNEKHAPQHGNPENVQDYVYPFVLRLKPGQKQVIEKPPGYDQFLAAGKFSLLNFKMFEEYDGEEEGTKRHYLPFWTYRRLIDCALFREDDYPFDISMINWDSNDLRGYNLIDKPAAQMAERLALAKQLSLGLVYWLQTAAPRDEGGLGYPEFELAKDILGSNDGLSLYPYIREARRLEALYTIVEEDIVSAQKAVRESEIFAETEEQRAVFFKDSVGIGHYPVDIHGDKEVAGTAQPTRPFQVPASALVPRTCANLLAASKNIGVSHITNGSYRLHPVEWAIGTASGAMAHSVLRESVAVQAIATNELFLLKLQISLARLGAPIYWFDDVSPERESFAAIQIAAQTGLLPINSANLSFNPEALVTAEETKASRQRLKALCQHLGLKAPEFTEKEMPAPASSLSREALAAYLFNLLLKALP